MKKLLAIALLAIFTIPFSYAQNKKVAVVSFYIVKKLGVTEFGDMAETAVRTLVTDPKFNMEPFLAKFHEEFFNTYSKNFPFQLLPETEILNNEAYKAFNPTGEATSGVFKDNYNLPYSGYKILLPFASQNEENLLKIFTQADGVMRVYLDFDLAKTGLGGMGIVRVNAFANIALYNKAGNKVFSIRENAKSKKISPLVKGVPVLTPEQILPMCESAFTELLADLQKDLPKIIKKADAKL